MKSHKSLTIIKHKFQTRSLCSSAIFLAGYIQITVAQRIHKHIQAISIIIVLTLVEKCIQIIVLFYNLFFGRQAKTTTFFFPLLDCSNICSQKTAHFEIYASYFLSKFHTNKNYTQHVALSLCKREKKPLNLAEIK